MSVTSVELHFQNRVCHCLHFLKVQPLADKSACWNSGQCCCLCKL